MKKCCLSFFIILFSVIITSNLCLAQDYQWDDEEEFLTVDDIFAKATFGDRVEIELSNGTIFVGTVINKTDNKIRIDVTLESDMLQGAIEFNKRNISSIRILLQLTDEEKEKIKKIRQDKIDKYKEEIKKTEEEGSSESSSDENEDIDTSGSELLTKFPPDKWSKKKYRELIKKPDYQLSKEEKEFVEVYEDWIVELDNAKDESKKKLLEKFPPDKGWNEKKYKKLKNKFIVTGIQLTKEEQEFVDNYDKWKEAKKKFGKKGESEDKDKEKEKKKEK